MLIAQVYRDTSLGYLPTYAGLDHNAQTGTFGSVILDDCCWSLPDRLDSER